jgi:putative colanic acid biosynthesis acetyltransferase WcaF
LYKSKVRLDFFDKSVNLDRGRPYFVEVIWYIFKVVFFLSAIPYPSRFKLFLLRRFGAKVGKGIVIKPQVNIHFPWKLEIGDHVWIGEEAYILNFEKVSIGDHVCISQRAFLCGGNHNFRTTNMEYKNGPIRISAGAWIGAGAFVSGNLTIGVDTVVSAYSVVTSDLKDNSIYKGNPAIYKGQRWPAEVSSVVSSDI